jgi:hypothetical protein
MAELVKVRRLSDEEGQRLLQIGLLQIVRRGEPKMTKSVIRYRRAMVVLAWPAGTPCRRSPGWSPPTRTPCGR